MKKISTLIIVLAFALAGTASAQCMPDPGITGGGIFPTPITGVPVGNVGTPYAEVFTINVPQDTSLDLSVFAPGLPTLTVTVNFLQIDSFGGLPPGLTSTCNPMSCNITGGNSGCIDLSGTPTSGGNFIANLQTTLNVTIPASIPFIGGTQQDVPGPLAYNIEILGGVSVDPGMNGAFTVDQSFPNPASEETRISFHTPFQSEIALEVFGVTGQRVFAQTVNYPSGEHAIDLDVRSLESGVYFYTLSNGSEKVTRRLIVSH
ncbi:MAG: T9SS type A sorting domain-containing protein [Bacteroidota bacterium]